MSEHSHALPRRLSDTEFRSTFRTGMQDILGMEDKIDPGWVIDVEPYLSAIPESELGRHPLLSGVPPSAVRRNWVDGFDHVLFPVQQSDTYLVVVVEFREGRVLGHYVLDLDAAFRE